MITLEIGCTPVFVGFTNAAEQVFTNTGTYHFYSISYVAPLVHTNVDMSGVTQGSIVTVTGDGGVFVTPGAPIEWAAGLGFVSAISTVGVILAIRRLFSWFGGLAGIETGERQ